MPFLFCDCGLDTCGVGNIQRHYPDFIVARIGQPAQLWMRSLDHDNPRKPAKHQPELSGELKPEPGLAPVIKTLGIAYSIKGL